MVIEVSIEADPVAQEILRLVADVGPWEGSATELLAVLDVRVSEATCKSRHWPKGPGPLGKRLLRAAPLLRAKDVLFEHFTVGKNKNRRMSLTPVNG